LTIYSLIPPKIRRLVPESWRTSIINVVRNRAVRRSLEPLKRSGTLTQQQLGAFHNAWGNEGYSADEDFLAELMKRLTKGPVLECGTGASTLLANELGRIHAFLTYSLEQDQEWSAFVRGFLKKSVAVRVIDAPLKRFSNYLWYDVIDAELPKHFALVVCDGPAIGKDVAEPFYSSWRYGVLAWLRETGRTFDVLVLDDVEDLRARDMLARWKQDWRVTVRTIKSRVGELAIVQSAD